MIAAGRQLDVLGDRHIEHAVLDGHVLVRHLGAETAVAAHNRKIPVAGVVQHGGIGERDKQMPRALGVDRLRRHRGEADLRHAAVAARKQDIGGRLAQLVGVGELAAGLRRIIDADGDALICRLVRALRLEVQRLRHGLAHLDRPVGDDHGLDGIKIALRRHLAVVVQ